MNVNTTRALILLAIGDSLFGALGLFTRHFSELGLDSAGISFIRTAVTAAVILPIVFIHKREALRVGLKGILIFLAFGAVKLISDITFFYALDTTTMSLATMLQMTFPSFVLIISFFIFRESLTMRKLMAVLIAFIGCTLMSGAAFSDGMATSEGIIAALISGLGIAVYVIGGTLSYQRGYDPAAYMVYTAIFANLMIIPFIDLSLVSSVVFDINEIVYVLGLGVIVSIVPVYIQAWSAKYLLPTTISVVAILELVSASIIGATVFGEILSPLDIAGVIFAILAIFIINAHIFLNYRDRFEAIRKRKTSLDDQNP